MTKLKREGKIKANGISIHDELVGQANAHIEAVERCYKRPL
jgi:predicted aldo/keto reductase-like oxidoreductase